MMISVGWENLYICDNDTTPQITLQTTAWEQHPTPLMSYDRCCIDFLAYHIKNLEHSA